MTNGTQPEDNDSDRHRGLEAQPSRADLYPYCRFVSLPCVADAAGHMGRGCHVQRRADCIVHFRHSGGSKGLVRDRGYKAG